MATGQEIYLVLCNINSDATGNKVQGVTGSQNLEEHDASLQSINGNVSLMLYK